MDNTISFSKESLRSEMRQLRKLLHATISISASQNVLKNLLPLLTNVKKIGVYHAVGSELSLSLVIDYALKSEIEVFLPVAYKENRLMRFEKINVRTESRQLFYPEDYQLASETKCYNLDLVLLPLVALDVKGYRLGQGGGYYDTTFASLAKRPLLCGVGYADQLLESVPHDEWDLKLDYFVSEQRLIKF